MTIEQLFFELIHVALARGFPSLIRPVQMKDGYSCKVQAYKDRWDLLK